MSTDRATINYADLQDTTNAFNLVSTRTDFNDDGLADFLWHNPTPTGVFSVWFMNGTTRLGVGQFLPFTATCNLGIWAEVYRSLGGLRLSYPQAHDVEFCWRAQLAGHDLGFAADAVVHYRYRTTVRGIVRQSYLSALDAVQLHRDYRAAGAPGRLPDLPVRMVSGSDRVTPSREPAG